jgi:hypothetical protein
MITEMIVNSTNPELIGGVIAGLACCLTFSTYLIFAAMGIFAVDKVRGGK